MVLELDKQIDREINVAVVLTEVGDDQSGVYRGRALREPVVQTARPAQCASSSGSIVIGWGQCGDGMEWSGSRGVQDVKELRTRYHQKEPRHLWRVAPGGGLPHCGSRRLVCGIGLDQARSGGDKGLLHSLVRREHRWGGDLIDVKYPRHEIELGEQV